MVKFFVIFVIVIFILSTTRAKLLQDTNFLVDFIARQNCSTHIVTVTCLPKDKLLSMTKTFLKNFIAVSHLKENHFTEKLELYQETLTFIVDARCQDNKNILNQVNGINDKFGKQYFTESFNWIILEENELNGSILNSNFYCGVNSKVFLIGIKEQEYKIDTIFKYSKQDVNFTKNDIGVWTATSGFLYFKELNIASVRSNLKGLNLRVVYPYKYSSSSARGFDFRQIGNKNLLLNMNLFKILFAHLNATYSEIFFDQPLENTLINKNNEVFLHLKFGMGDIIGNRSKCDCNFRLPYTFKFKQLCAQKQENEDLGKTIWCYYIEFFAKLSIFQIQGIPLTVVKERLNDFRYLIPSSPNNKAFIFRAPTLAFIHNVYNMPFYTTSWYCLWGVLLIATIVLFIIDVVYKKLLPEVEIHLSLFDIIMIELSALFQKSSNWEFKSWSGRIATGFLYMTLMIVTISYTASIVVYLQAASEDITDLKNLYKSGIKMGSENISYTVHETLMVPREDLIEELLRKKIIANYNNANHTFIMSIEEGIKKVQTQFFAYYTFLETAYDVIANTYEEYEKCSLRTTPGFYGEKDKYLMVARNSTLTDFYRIGFRKLFETGIQRREYLNYYRQKPKCENTGISNFSGTGIVETEAVFLIFIIGIMLSFVLFLFEKIFHYYRNSRNYYKHYNQCLRSCGGTVIQPYAE